MASDSGKTVISPGLLEKIKFPPSPRMQRRIEENFQLLPNEHEWHVPANDDDDDFQPPRKRKAKEHSSPGSRFAAPTSEEELAKSSKGVIPQNTQKNDRWALSTFTEWIEQRNKRVTAGKDRCSKNVLETDDAKCLAKWLSLYVIEVRRKDGSKYPPATIHLLLCGLQRIMRRQNQQPFDIFDKKDVRFREFHGTMESVFQGLHKEGVGAAVKHVALITEEEEASLWEKEILGDHTPLALVRSVFYLNGKNFCLRGGKEHRELKVTQFVKCDGYYKYVENGSKAFRGGVTDLRRENKVVRQYPCPEAGRHCHVRLLDLYFSRLPENAREKGAFYFTPLRKIPSNPNQPWLSSVPIGWNKLDCYVRDMFAEAGIEGKSNHSLRVTGATRLYRSGVPERTIQARTGHKSIEALRVYERPGESDHKQACRALANITNSGPPAVKSSAGATRYQPQPQLSTGPPTFNFQGCSVNIYTGPVMTSSKVEETTHTYNELELTQEDVEDFDNF